MARKRVITKGELVYSTANPMVQLMSTGYEIGVLNNNAPIISQPFERMSRAEFENRMSYSLFESVKYWFEDDSTSKFSKRYEYVRNWLDHLMVTNILKKEALA